jgi:hypothetical protein
VNKDNDKNILLFPTDKIVRDNVNVLNQKRNEEFIKKIEQEQTRNFVETLTDDIIINLVKKFYDLAIKTNTTTFTRDLALLTDILRGLIYRDYNVPHPAQIMADKIVLIRNNKDGSQSAKINYDIFLNKKQTTNKPLSKDVKNELKDLNEQTTLFEGEDLNKDD